MKEVTIPIDVGDVIRFNMNNVELGLPSDYQMYQTVVKLPHNR